MIGLDTNVVVRYLTKDDETQWQKAVDVINHSASCFICNVVLCEMVWVLQGKPYRYSQTEIMDTLELMLQSSKFEFENRSIIYQALSATKQGKADFADYLIGAVSHHHGAIHTVTFDRKLKTIKRFKVLD